jgi:phi13 family phage major tail protein
MSENQSYVGLSNLYAAEVLTDTAATYLADTPFYLAPVCEATAEPKVDAKTQYADNKPYDAMTAEGETTIKLKLTNLSAAAFAAITGCILDTTTGRVYDNGGVPPYMALGFQALRSDDKTRYFWFLKGRFSKPKDDLASQTDSVDFKVVELDYTAIRTIHEFVLSGTVTDSAKRVFGDEETLSFSATNWYTQVQVPAVATPSALALSSSTPTDDTTGISKTADLVLVFNNRLADDAEYGIVLTKADGTKVTITTITASTDRKTFTCAHGSLSPSIVHLLSYGVTDIYGSHLAGIVSFTTTT